MQPAYAIDCPKGLSKVDCDAVNGGWVSWVPDNCTATDQSGNIQLVGSDNQEKAFNYFVGKGLTAAQSAGILGNLIVESSVNPSAEEANGGPGRGIAQWGVGQRWDGKDQDGKYLDDTVYGFANGRKVDDLGLQLDFIWYEVTTGPYANVLTALKATKTTDDATQVWMDKYESPNPTYAHADIRKQDAQEVLTKYGSQASATVASANSFCGRSTNFATNFVFYKQCAIPKWIPGLESQAEYNAALAWTSAPYGDATICDAGCGPSAMAMIVTNLTGQRVTPLDAATYGAAHGTAAPLTDNKGNPIPGTVGKAGSYSTQLGPVIGGHWGLKTTRITPDFNIDKVNQVLRSGGLVLAGAHMIDGDAQKTGPFSTGGHFVVIRALTDDGKWLIGNPGGWPDDTKYDPVWLTTHISFDPNVDHSTWAITR